LEGNTKKIKTILEVVIETITLMARQHPRAA
jgi:hypothetical protein